MQQVVPQISMKLPSLNLDHDVVLSAWEQIGGDIFLGSDFDFHSDCIDIDLSGIEASLKQSSSASLEQFSNISPVPNLFPSIPDFSFPALTFGVADICHPDVKPHEKMASWSQPFLTPPCNVPAPVPHIKVEPSVQEPHASSSSLSSNSADIAIVPEVTSHPASSVRPAHHHTSSMHSVPQSFVPSMMPQVGLQMTSSKPMDTEVWRTRKECLERYKEKKARRMYTKKIRYQLRKINADKRPRIKGRFVKKEELDEYIKSQPEPKSAQAMDEDDCSDVDEEEDNISSD